jgi:signal transduction histidine kinase
MAVIITNSFERLAEANRMKSEFISIVSHQLRSPLSNLRWTIELLMSGRLGRIEEKQTEYFKILKENSNRMMELIKDLLIVSRIETAKLPTKKIEFSLEDLVEDLIKEFTPLAQASNVKVKFGSQSDLPKIFADYSQIRLVIENFLDNAIHYIKESGLVEIKIEKRNQNLYFEIKDDGVGIPREDQRYIFQKFFRAENILKYQTQGSGLGLYISKAVVERSGGKIGFSSQEGVGSTFWFTLPIK